MDLATRIAKRYAQGPLAVPGVKSYPLDGGPPGLSLDLKVAEASQTPPEAPVGEVGVWVNGTAKDALKRQERAVLGLVSKFTRATASWDGDWHQSGELWLRGVSFR
jgi:hypothetical protein